MGRLSKMIRKQAIQKKQGIPYRIITLFDDECEILNSSSKSVSFPLNRLSITSLWRKMCRTAADGHCAVLAANQINSNQRLVVMHNNLKKQGKWFSENYSNFQQYGTYINARIHLGDCMSVVTEQSVSFPFIHADTRRFDRIEISYQNESEKHEKRELIGFESYAFQQAYDYTYGRNILDWRLHFGDIRVQEDIQQKLPKTTALLNEYSLELKQIFGKFQHLRDVPDGLTHGDGEWFSNRGLDDVLSIEQDYILRIHKYYRKQMILLMERLNEGLI